MNYTKEGIQGSSQPEAQGGDKEISAVVDVKE